MKTEAEIEALVKKLEDLKADIAELSPEEVEQVMEKMPLTEDELDNVDGGGILFVPCTAFVNANVCVNANAAANANAISNANAFNQANLNVVANANAAWNANMSVNANANSK